MPTSIKCPRCGHQFPMEEAVSEEYKKELREQMIDFTKKKEDEYQLKLGEVSRQLQVQQEQFDRKLADEKKILQQSLEENLRKAIGSDFENQIQLLEQSNKVSEEKLKTARQKELEFLQKEQALINKEAELELSVQRKLQQERTRLSEEIRLVEEQKVASRETEHQLRHRELEKQLEDQKKLAEDAKKLAEEMRRKAEQGSMQLQGEVQELALEELLKTTFPFDEIMEVGKGVRGADCIQVVRNHLGQDCGKIIYESKRTRDFSQDWIEKLKADLRSQGAQVAVIVTQSMPKDMERFGEKNGVWICSFAEVKALAHVLRDGIMKIFQAAKSQENKGDKMHLLYDYLTSGEFAEQWKAIREGFVSMKLSIQRERDAMEKLWKAREKQLEKVLLNAAHIKGSVEGIAGQDSINLNLLDEGDESYLPE